MWILHSPNFINKVTQYFILLIQLSLIFNIHYKVYRFNNNYYYSESYFSIMKSNFQWKTFSTKVVRKRVSITIFSEYPEDLVVAPLTPLQRPGSPEIGII